MDICGLTRKWSHGHSCDRDRFSGCLRTKNECKCTGVRNVVHSNKVKRYNLFL